MMRRTLALLLGLVVGLAPTGTAHAATGPDVVGTYRYLYKPLYNGDWAAAVSETGQFVAYVVAGKVYVRNTEASGPRLVGTTSADWVAISGDGRYVFHVNSNLRLIRWDRMTGVARNTGIVMSNPDRPARISSDGRWFWLRGSRYDVTDGSRLTVVPADTTADDFGQEFDADLGPDGTSAVMVTTDPGAGTGHCRIRLWSEAAGLVETPVKGWCTELDRVWLRAGGATVFFQVTDGFASTYRKLAVGSGSVTTLAPPMPASYQGGEDPVQNVYFSQGGTSMVYGLENYWSCEPVSCTQVRRWNMRTGAVTVLYRNWTNPDHKVILGAPVGINPTATQIAVDMSGWDRNCCSEKSRLGLWHR